MDRIIPGIVAIACAFCLAVWLGGAEVQGLQERLPQAENAVSQPPQVWRPISETATLARGDGVPANLPGAWPRFRGANADGISREEPDLARTWPRTGPKVLWSIPVGEGHAGAAVLNGRVYLLDYDQAARRDTLRCLSLEDGRDIWRFSYPVEVLRQYGMSRTVPAVTDRYVVCLGPKCHVTCVDAQTGELKWAYDLVRDFAAQVPPWYAGQCPLIDRDRAIIAVGGKDVLMMAVDCETGKIAWKTPNPNRWTMTHSSVVRMDFNGRRMYLYCASDGLAAVSAEDGRILWQTDAWRVTFANIPCPVIVGEDRIFLAGGYGAGSMMIQLKESGGVITPQVVYKLKQNVFSTEQHTAIYYNGFIYGVIVDGPLVCLDPAGEPMWSSGRGRKFGRGNYIIANGLLFVMSDSTGELTLVEATASGYHELARAPVVTGPDAYGPMSIAQGRLIVRNLNTLTCLDVRREQP